jgi:hypothetical protein
MPVKDGKDAHFLLQDFLWLTTKKEAVFLTAPL